MTDFTIPTGKTRRNATSIDQLMNESMKRKLNRIVAVADRESRKLSQKERERREAIAETIDEWLGFLDENEEVETLKAFFIQIELLASAKNRRRIAGHPLRPQEGVEEVVAAELARRAAERGRAQCEKEAAAKATDAAAETDTTTVAD
ncbi:hypothetical protein [Rhodovulum adriaticum]|uniref:Uncharacterized protein n=1 Tax=Rhodovulum adriaticum TaxID=35804 RepID=A0A4R2NFD2_RHOAD|nr:hypothetical protein [Rhodovulum adriaticum]MBK1637174.1 hypothetical protein [Rhodovulum adriaticum]TCP19960.1 hypothetical protein EV656_12410 [Rhodovulum adriaticum]